MEIGKDGRAESVTVDTEGNIAARVQMWTDEHGNIRVRTQILFLDEEAEKAKKRTLQAHASGGS
jgi:hypothetical protein